MASPPPVARAALVGLVLGLLGASLVFLFSALGNVRRECAFPETEECDFEMEEAREVGRLQGLAAIGCALVGGGMGLALRRK